MIYRYQKYIEQGAYGFTLDIRGDLENRPTLLGVINGFSYAYLPQEVVQDERLNATVVTLTSEEKEELKTQRLSYILKEGARNQISKVGDIPDLIADITKLVELTLMMVARLAGDIWGTDPISEENKELYKNRNHGFLQAVDSGAVTLRGSFDDVNLMMTKLMSRTSKINEIVRDSYIQELQRLGLL